jgi:hypothetical protein
MMDLKLLGKRLKRIPLGEHEVDVNPGKKNTPDGHEKILKELLKKLVLK